jgi:hypothetical protein
MYLKSGGAHMDGDSNNSTGGSYGGGDTSSSDSSSSSTNGSSSYSGYGGDTGGYGGNTSSSTSGNDSSTSCSGNESSDTTAGYSSSSSTSDSDSNTGNYGGIAGAGADYSGATANYSSNDQGNAAVGEVSSSTSDSDSSTGSYGGIAGSGADYSGAAAKYSSNEQENATGGGTFSSASDSNSTNGSYGGIVGLDYSDAVQNSYEDTTGTVADIPSWNDSLDSYSGLGVIGGEPCSEDYSIADFGDSSLADYSQGLYTDDAGIQTYENVLDNIQNTWDSVAQWTSENITQPLQAAFNQPVQAPESDSVSGLMADSIPGMTKEEVENGLSAMGVASIDETPTANMIGDDPANGIQSVTDNVNVAQWISDNIETIAGDTYDNYVTQPLNNLENIISATYDEGVQAVKSVIQDNKALDNIVNCPGNIQTGEVVLGVVQAVGGFTEAALGYSVAAGGSIVSDGIAAVPSISLGGYLQIDGLSNLTGGLSRADNGLEGIPAGDTANFVKNAYIAYGPSADKVYSGANIYNCTQLAIGGYSLASGVANLAKNAVNVEDSYLGYEAATQGADTWSSISTTLKNINYSQWTTGGLAVKSVDINLGNIGTRTFNFGIDGTNASQSIPPMPATNNENKRN